MVDAMASIPLDREFIAWADTKKVWRPGTQVADNTVKGWYAQYVRDAVVQPDASVRLLEREGSDMWARITKDPSVVLWTRSWQSPQVSRL